MTINARASRWPLSELRSLGQDWLRVLTRPAGQDLISGLTVAAVALPLNIALAVASGLPPSAGLIAGAIGGGVAALLGGSPLQVTGPAAALNVMVFALCKDFGPSGVAAACLVVGIIQVFLSATASGRLVHYVPEAVLAGFTTGVGLTILDNQIPELLGFDYTVFELAQMLHRPDWLHEVSWSAVVCGLAVALFVTSCRPFRRFPAAILAIALVTAIAQKLEWPIARVGAIPAAIPDARLPAVPFVEWMSLLLAAIPLGLLASIESLLSAQAIDRMAQSRKPHNSDLELLGQGVANFATGLFGGMPVSGVIVRSSLNVQCGAKSRLSAAAHAVFLFGAVMFLSEVLAKIPLSALAGLLCVVGLRLIEANTLRDLFRSNRTHALAFLCAAIGTVSGYLMTGLVLALIIHLGGSWLDRLVAAQEAVDRSETLKRQTVRSPAIEEGQRGPDAIRAEINRAPTGRLPAVIDHDRESEISPTPEWINHIRDRAHLAASAFVHDRASVIGCVILGEHVHIAAEASVRADEGSPFYIGSNSNIQDGVVVHALKDRWVKVGGEEWAVYVGDRVSIAHQALVHGPCFIGDDTFVGFQAVVHDATVGSGCYVGIGAVIVGVDIPDGRYIPHRAVIDSQEKADLLPPVTGAHKQFNEAVVGVNTGLAAAYRTLSDEGRMGEALS